MPTQQVPVINHSRVAVHKGSAIDVDPVKEVESTVRRIAFLGDYPPRRCGIATFTFDLLNAVADEHARTECFAVPVNDVDGHYEYPGVVRCEIDELELASYQRAADFLNFSNVDVACVQHEFGIYGGAAGSHILTLLRELNMPIVTTLHTVLREPNSEQRRVVQELVARSTRLVVMTERGRQMLCDLYQAPRDKIDLIPHGIPDMPFVDPAFYKEQFALDGKTVLLTFGLLSPNKGIENVLKALPLIVSEFPDLVYVVVGATHPNELRERGEAYRLSLEILAKKYKVEKNVVFFNRFVEIEELKAFIGAADLYVTPYLNEAQITSGTLAYAFGSGKAVVSTPYWHAAELLKDQRGVLVPFGDSPAIGREVIALLRGGARQQAMRKNAYELGREVTWSRVARRYMTTFQRARAEGAVLSRRCFAAKTLDRQPREVPRINLDHLARMTDATGVFQHAIVTVPNLNEGYCTDDNARGLILSVLLDELKEEPQRARSLGTTCAAFLNYAFDPATNRFHNHLSFDRHWLDQKGSEDCHARALWALGVVVGRSPHVDFQKMAAHLFSRALPAVADFSSPRAWAFSLIGIHEYLRRLGSDRLVVQTREALVTRMKMLFDRVAQPGWTWFEDVLSYDNAKLAHALILSGRASGNPPAYETGLAALRWLVQVQTSENGHFRPIGSNGFFRRGAERADFDQQPVEAYATVSACLEAYRSTSDWWWYEQANRALDWFLGWNDLGLEVFSPSTGGCRDALHVDRVNDNQGAESTLAYLLSLGEIRLMRDTVTAFNQPAV